MLKTFAEDPPAAGLWENLVNLFVALWGVLVSLVEVIAPWSPLLAWIAFWLFAVNWVKFRQVLIRGGFFGVLLIGFGIVLIWGTISPPPDDYHLMLGMKLSNYVGKTVYVTVLFCIMFLCGSLQLAGFLPDCCRFAEDEEPAEDEHAHAAH